MHPQQLFDIRPGLAADFLQHSALLANDDALMGIPFAIDGGVNFHEMIIFLLHGHHFHAHAVGHFIPQIPQGFFPDQFGADIPFRLIGEHIIRKILGADGQMRRQLLFQFLHPIAGAGADGQDGVIAGILEGINDGQQILGLLHIDLVEHQHFIYLFMAHFLHDGAIMGADGSHIHQHQQGVDALHGLFNGFHHKFAQLGAGAMNTGGIHENDLAVFAAHHAHHAVTGGLGTAGYDGHLFPDQGIEQGGFPYVGTAYDGGKPGMKFFSFGHFLSFPPNPAVITYRNAATAILYHRSG